MFDNIHKGKISKIEGPADKNGNETMARVVPDLAAEIVTAPLVIPWWLRGQMGKLKPESEILFVLFSDQSGMILSRADGEWSGTLPGGLTVSGTLEVKGAVTVQDLKTGQVPSYNSHVHDGVEPGSDKTGMAE